MRLFNKNEKYISFKGKKYALNLQKLTEICLSSSKSGGTSEMEISQAYEAQDNGEFTLASKVERETKTHGSLQNDMIIYDFVKLLILSLLDNAAPEADFEWTFSLSLAANTLISWGILEEVTE